MYRLFLGRVGTSAEAHSGTGSLAASAVLAASGKKAGRGPGTVAAGATLGQGGSKRAFGQAPDWLYAEDGVTRLTDENGIPLWSDLSGLPIEAIATLDAQGYMGGAGVGTIAETAVFSALASKSASGDGGITPPVLFVDGGRKAASGAGSLSLAATLAASGEAQSPDRFGTGAIVLSATLAAFGYKHSAPAPIEPHYYYGRTVRWRPPQVRRSGIGYLDLDAVLSATGHKSFESDDELVLALAA